MSITGHCYCGNVSYEAKGPVFLKAECLCRECQYITGGGSLHIIAVPLDGFALTKGEVKGYKRADIEGAVTRQFCPNCGTHMFTRAPALADAIIIKVGTLDDPSSINPVANIWASSAPAWACLDPQLERFEGQP